MAYQYVEVSSVLNLEANVNVCGSLGRIFISVIKELYTENALKTSVKKFDLLLRSDSIRKVSYKSNVCPSIITYETYSLS